MSKLNKEEKKVITDLHAKKPKTLLNLFLDRNPYEKIELPYFNAPSDYAGGYSNEGKILADISIINDSLSFLESHRYIRVTKTHELIDLSLASDEHQQISKQLENAIIDIHNTHIIYNESFDTFIRNNFQTDDELEKIKTDKSNSREKWFNRILAIIAIIISIIALFRP